MSSRLSKRKQQHQDELEKKLYFAICDNDMATLGELIQGGLDANTTFYGSNQWQKTALHLCCEKGHLECARLLYEAGASLEQQDAWLHNPLMYSIFTERSDMAKFLLERGCDVDEHDRFGRTALHFAVSHETTECMKLLLDYGADVDSIDETGRTPLWVAASEDGRHNFITCLIDGGADIQLCDRREKRTPLHAALRHTKKDTLSYLKLFLNVGANVNTVDELGHTPMTTLIQNGSSFAPVTDDTVTMVMTLLDVGFDVNLSQASKSNRFYGTALKAAVLRGSIRLVDILLEAGANPDIHDERCRTPLIWASYHNQIEICKRLVAANCSLDHVGHINRHHDLYMVTAFHCAVLMEHFEIAQFLILVGYDLRFEKYLIINDEVPDALVRNYEFWGELRDRVINTQSLSALCRQAIRKQVGFDICGKVELLPIPARLKQYILLADLVNKPS